MIYCVYALLIKHSNFPGIEKDVYSLSKSETRPRWQFQNLNYFKDYFRKNLFILIRSNVNCPGKSSVMTFH